MEIKKLKVSVIVYDNNVYNLFGRMQMSGKHWEINNNESKQSIKTT